MPQSNLYQDLKNALENFKGFLDANSAIIKPAIMALKSIIPQVSDLLDKLVDLMGKLKTEIQSLNVGAIPGLAQVSVFTEEVKTVLQTAENLLPNDKGEIDGVLGVSDVIGGLPGLDQVKRDILTLIDAIIVDLNQLKS